MLPRACAHEFSPHSVGFCRILSRPAEGELGHWGLGIVDWGLQGCLLGLWFG